LKPLVKSFTKKDNGTTMPNIAQMAGVNLALLYYYFRTKDRIFEIIFNEAFSLLFKRLSKALATDTDIFEKIKRMIAK
jgi:AcrR family transcriptional regulator